MSRPYQQYFDEMHGQLKAAFDRSNPEYWAAYQGRPKDIDRLKEIADHTNQEICALEDNFEEERQNRIGRKAVEVWMERSRQHEYLAPQARAHVLSETSILEEARKRVEQDRAAEIEIILENEEDAIWRVASGEHLQGQSFSKKEIEKMTAQEKTVHFKAELHKLVDDSNTARFQVNKIINNERERLIEEAKENGSQDPLADVKSLTGSMYKGVQDKLHGDIHALCLKYGYSADRQQIEFYANQEAMEQDSDKNRNDQVVGDSHDVDDVDEIDSFQPASKRDDDQSQ